MADDIISFIRQKDYKLVKPIGQGGFGKTVLLKDNEIDELFVCKKYEPISGIQKEEYYSNFVQEIKCLFLLYHRNVVRIFNYYLYPNKLTGFILMEYIQGDIISKYIKKNPEKINDIFLQTIEGFCYLEEKQILHRDIRNENILVNDDGVVKIIDFGFGKRIITNNDYNKSISLNWWCPLPNDFEKGRYSFSTEIYFIGMLFKSLLQENDIEFFQYINELKMMTEPNEENRIESFNKLLLLLDETNEIEELFDRHDKRTYQDFANSIYELIAKIGSDVSFNYDSRDIVSKLTEIYNKNMLESEIFNSTELLYIFILGKYSYWKEKTISVYSLRDFLQLFKSSSNQKQKIILNNLYNRLKSIDKYEETKTGDIPF